MAVRALLCDLKYLLSLTSKLVDELCMYSEARSLVDSNGDDKLMHFIQSSDWDDFWLK